MLYRIPEASQKKGGFVKGQSHDASIGTFYFLDENRGAALDAVGAGLVHGLAAGDVTFFAIPEGQSSSVSGSAITKSKYHTNMTAVKMLPVPQRFDVFGLSWCMDSATVAAVNDIRNKCAVQFYIGNTPYATLRLSLIPFYSSVNAAFDGTNGAVPNVAWCTGPKEMYDLRTFDLDSGVLIPQRIALQENFSVILKIDSALNMSAAKDVCFTLHGIKWTEIRQG